MSKNDNGFIVQFWDAIFNFLSKISIFYWIRKITKNRSYKFVEAWVVGNLLFAIFGSLLVYFFIRNHVVLIIFISYAILIVFETIIYQINVLLFHPYRAHKAGKEYYIKSPTRMVILLLHNYAGIIMWFSLVVMSLLVISGDTLDHSWFYYIKSSVQCFSTLNQESITALSTINVQLLSAVAFFEFIAGLIMTTITLARFIGLLPGVKTKDKI